jgi:hypothetical protein
MSLSQRFVEISSTITVGEFNKSNGENVVANEVPGSPRIVVITSITAVSNPQPVEVIINGDTTLPVSPVESTFPAPKEGAAENTDTFSAKFRKCNGDSPAPYIRIAETSSLQIKNLEDDALVRVVGYNLEQNDGFRTTWLYV